MTSENQKFRHNFLTKERSETNFTPFESTHRGLSESVSAVRVRPIVRTRYSKTFRERPSIQDSARAHGFQKRDRETLDMSKVVACPGLEVLFFVFRNSLS